jgi:hypothetical protein
MAEDQMTTIEVGDRIIAYLRGEDRLGTVKRIAYHPKHYKDAWYSFFEVEYDVLFGTRLEWVVGHNIKGVLNLKFVQAPKQKNVAS